MITDPTSLFHPKKILPILKLLFNTTKDRNNAEITTDGAKFLATNRSCSRHLYIATEDVLTLTNPLTAYEWDVFHERYKDRQWGQGKPIERIFDLQTAPVAEQFNCDFSWFVNWTDSTIPLIKYYPVHQHYLTPELFFFGTPTFAIFAEHKHKCPFQISLGSKDIIVLNKLLKAVKLRKNIPTNLSFSLLQDGSVIISSEMAEFKYRYIPKPNSSDLQNLLSYRYTHSPLERKTLLQIEKDSKDSLYDIGNAIYGHTTVIDVNHLKLLIEAFKIPKEVPIFVKPEFSLAIWEEFEILQTHTCLYS